MEKSLVVYYSKSGNTRRVANRIKEMINADIAEITRKRSGTSDIGDMLRLYIDPLVPLAPMSENNVVDISEYDHIYIGTPVWGMTYSLPVKEFISKTDFTGKKISLFCTHDGGVGNTLSAMNRKAENAELVRKIDIVSTNCRNVAKLDDILNKWIG